MKHFRIGAADGLVGGQVGFGNCLFTGNGVSLDYAAAAERFGKAAAQGDVIAALMRDNCLATLASAVKPSEGKQRR